MRNWLRGKPKCPVDPATKEWIESRFAWLTNEFGLDRLQNGKTVLPTDEFLPDEYDYTVEGVEDLMVRVAQFMDVDPSTLQLSFYENETPQHEEAVNSRAAGMHLNSQDKFDIWMEVHSLENPVGVVATLAHEIAHVVLLGQNRLGPEDEDHEELSDLLAVFSGLGIFPANFSLLETNWTDGQWSGWSVGRSGYLSMDMYGYSMALYTLARNDPKPDWASFLRPDVLAPLKRGIRFVTETGDCEFLPALGRQP